MTRNRYLVADTVDTILASVREARKYTRNMNLHPTHGFATLLHCEMRHFHHTMDTHWNYELDPFAPTYADYTRSSFPMDELESE